MGILILLLILEEKPSMFLPFTIITAVSLLYLTFIMLKYVSSISNLLRNFIMKECIFLAFFSVSIDPIMQFFSFILLVWHVTFINLRILNYQSMTGINLSLSHCIVILIYFWIWFANIVEKFCNSLKLLIYSFLVVSITGFGNRIIQASQNKLKSVSIS